LAISQQQLGDLLTFVCYFGQLLILVLELSLGDT